MQYNSGMDEKRIWASGTDPIVVEFSRSSATGDWHRTQERKSLHTHDVSLHDHGWEVPGLDTNLMFSTYPPFTMLHFQPYAQVAMAKLAGDTRELVVAHDNHINFYFVPLSTDPAPNMEYKRCSSCISGLGALTGYYQPGQLSPVFLRRRSCNASLSPRTPSSWPTPSTLALPLLIKDEQIVKIPLDPVWISWNKVRPGLTRAISPKPWSPGGRFSVCQSWCCGFVTDPRPLVAATIWPSHFASKTPLWQIVKIPLDPVWISWNKVRPGLTRAISPKPWSPGGRFSVCQSWCCGFVTDPRPLVAATEGYKLQSLNLVTSHSLEFSADGLKLYLAANTGRIYLLDLSAGCPESYSATSTEKGVYYKLAADTEGKMVAAADGTGLVDIFDGTSMKLKCRLPRNLYPISCMAFHSGRPNVLVVCYFNKCADLAPKEMATSDMRNRRHVQPLLTWSTNAAHPVSLDMEPLQGTNSWAS
ncbi:CIRH1A [Cordylochernes scorpioides]|uniref:CIRH1A n=1 Tax=Cordylochernes scorpioides TaxID=51811 RepID=A0ABY6L176_9ARAC|nr:CIRH1A [Cordylochernes scorpioides]